MKAVSPSISAGDTASRSWFRQRSWSSKCGRGNQRSAAPSLWLSPGPVEIAPGHLADQEHVETLDRLSRQARVRIQVAPPGAGVVAHPLVVRLGQQVRAAADADHAREAHRLLVRAVPPALQGSSATA